MLSQQRHLTNKAEHPNNTRPRSNLMKARTNIVKFKHSYKKRENIKPYAKYDLDWTNITRANDNSKMLSEASVMLCSRLEYQLHRNNYRPVFLTSDWFAQATKKKRHQNANLRGQVSHIYNFKWHPKVRVEEVLLSNVFEVWSTTEAPKILNLEDVETTQKKPNLKAVEVPKNSTTMEKKFYEGGEKILQPIVDKGIINPPKEDLFIPNNEKLKIKKIDSNKNSKTSQQETPQQKSSLGDDFVANTETLERDWELDCADTVLTEPPEYLLAEAGLAKGESDYYGHLPPDTPESVETPIASDYVLGDTTPKTEAKKRTATPPILTNQAKEEKPMAIPQTQLEPRQQLNYQILKTFPTATAAELQQKLDIKPIAPNKIGLAFKQGLELKNNEKQQLRETIQLVYGKSVKMILIKPGKPEMATKEDTEKRSEPKPLTPEESKWEAVKNDVLNALFLDQKDLMKINLDQVEVIDLEGRKLKLQATYSICHKMDNKQSLIESMAKKHDVDIEVKNITDNDTLYFPWIKPNLDFLGE
jgi:hypothetical protein